MNTLSAVIHGESGMGKSWMAKDTPTPRLILDVEGRTKYVPLGTRVVWDPRTPIPDTTGVDTVIVKLRDFAVEMDLVYQWLASGQHPFRAVIVDSLTELQKRAMDSLVGTNAPQTQDWGELLRKLEFTVRKMRDLTDHPTHPIPLVYFICFTDDVGGFRRPLLQGKLAKYLPFYVDLNAYLYVAQNAEEPGGLMRVLQIQPVGNIVCKDGTDLLTQRYGSYIAKPSFNEMLAVLNATEPVSA